MMNDFVADADCWMVIALPGLAELIEVTASHHFTTSQALIEKFLSRALAVDRILAIRPDWKDPTQIDAQLTGSTPPEPGALL